VAAFAGHLAAPGGTPAQVTPVCCDRAPASIRGVEAPLPPAALPCDRDPVLAILNRAVDEVRRQEAREGAGLKATRYRWRKNPENLPGRQRAALRTVKRLDLQTARASQVQLALRRCWTFASPQGAARSLTRWSCWATHSQLAPLAEAARTLKRHWDGILAFLRSRITNGIVEGLTSKIKTALKRAYGFKTFATYRTIIYLVAGKLELPTRC